MHVSLIIDQYMTLQNAMHFRLRSILLLISASIATVTLARAQAIAPTRVAIINAQKAVGDTQEIKKAQAALEAKYRPRQQEIDALQRDLQNIQQQLNAPNVAPERAAQLRADGTQKQKRLQRLSEDLQADVNNERQDILGRSGRQMTEVVKKLAEERNLDIVIDITNTLYFKPALDITADATAAYDKAYPAR
ncbi:MAG: OmpH family outer membrane protein [Acidobacteriaceae bacterium]|nr:OmpH family outer membrane protein [Acidobacteriaceae bacterium]MBV9779354.1 OmpH family outer membrane protein [Acidobacteriaceae bacterium]